VRKLGQSAATSRRLIAGIIAALGTFGAAPPPATAPAEPHRVTVPSIPGMTGHFVLKTTAGAEVTQASFPGKWLVIYFGYTLCPDACPTALNAVAGALGELGPLAAKVQPLFITVDPERDTPQTVADYVKAFDPRILGLSGTNAQTAAAARAFHVYYAVRKLGNGEYAIDHSSFIYVVNPSGQVVELLTGNLTAHPMAAALRDLVK
jgi:protein SCO1